MHILEVPSFFPPYGGDFCLDQAKALRSLGHTVRILSNIQLSIKNNLRHYITFPYTRNWKYIDEIEIYQSYTRGIPLVIRPNMKHWTNVVISMFDEYVSRYGLPDIIHAHCAKWAGYASMLISNKYQIPYVITEHLSALVYKEELERCGGMNAWQIPMIKQAYKSANMVVPVSEELVDNISCYFGKDYKWQTISNMIDVDFFRYKTREKKNEYHVVCIANYIPLKGYDILFPAFAKFHQKYNNVFLHVVGRGTDSNSCLQMSHTYNVSNVKFYGEVSRQAVRNILYQCHLLVLPSRSEAQGMVLLEAILTGIKTIATDRIPQLSISDATYIVPVDDVDALTKALEIAYETNDSYDGIKNSEAVKNIVSPSVVGTKLIELFSNIINTNEG